MAPMTPGQLRTRQRVESLIKLASPVLDLHTKGQGIEDFSPTAPIVRAYKTVDTAFPSKTSPAQVVVEAATVKGGAFDSRLAAFKARVANSGGELTGPVEVHVNPAGTVAIVSVGLGRYVFNERLTPPQAVGILLIAAGIATARFG